MTQTTETRTPLIRFEVSEGYGGRDTFRIIQNSNDMPLGRIRWDKPLGLWMCSQGPYAWPGPYHADVAAFMQELANQDRTTYQLEGE